jgi:ribonuclease P protein component
MTRRESLGIRVVIDPAAAGVQVGFSTPKRIGSAVVRNKVRRQLRALMRERAPHLPAGWYFLAVEPQAVDSNWGQLGTTLDGLLDSALSTQQSSIHSTSSKGQWVL